MIILTERVNRAIQAAAKAHIGQMRKTRDVPAIAHMVAVAMIVGRYTDDEDTIVAAFLHDAAEDTSYSLDQIRQDFGNEVAEIVASVTEDKDPHDKSDRRATWEVRKQAYLDHLRQGTTVPQMLICAADKLHNVHELADDYRRHGQAVEGQFYASLDRKVWFYQQVTKILIEQYRDHPLLDQLQGAVEKLQELVARV